MGLWDQAVARCWSLAHPCALSRGFCHLQRCLKDLFHAQTGPRLKWSELMKSRHCETDEMCAIFKDRHPSTVAMTVLVVVEMFNALNALSENNSLLQVSQLLPALPICILLCIPFIPGAVNLEALCMLTLSHLACLLVSKRGRQHNHDDMVWQHYSAERLRTAFHTTMNAL